MLPFILVRQATKFAGSPQLGYGLLKEHSEKREFCCDIVGLTWLSLLPFLQNVANQAHMYYFQMFCLSNGSINILPNVSLRMSLTYYRYEITKLY